MSLLYANFIAQIHEKAGSEPGLCGCDIGGGLFVMPTPELYCDLSRADMVQSLRGMQ